MLIVLSGLPGTGKSAIAAGISAARGFPVLSVDPIESAIVAAGIPRSFETGLAGYVVVETVAQGLLESGISPVIDAVNSVDEARGMWRRLAARHSAQLVIIECVISDEAEQRARLAARDRGLAIPEPSWDAVVSRRDEWTPWPESHLTIDAIADLESNIAAVLRYLAED